MSRSVNKVILIGHLGRSAETAYTASGIAVTKFSVATNRRWKDKESDEWKDAVEWTNVVLWRGEKVAQYLAKGKQVYVEGRIATRTYEKDGVKHWVTEVIADEVILLGGNGEESGSDRRREPGVPKDGIGDDKVPF
jgi:single-strand DNA-binding protein